jgi:hypothetical protein
VFRKLQEKLTSPELRHQFLLWLLEDLEPTLAQVVGTSGNHIDLLRELVSLLRGGSPAPSVLYDLAQRASSLLPPEAYSLLRTQQLALAERPHFTPAELLRICAALSVQSAAIAAAEVTSDSPATEATLCAARVAGYAALCAGTDPHEAVRRAFERQEDKLTELMDSAP